MNTIINGMLQSVDLDVYFIWIRAVDLMWVPAQNPKNIAIQNVKKMD